MNRKIEQSQLQLWIVALLLSSAAVVEGQTRSIGATIPNRDEQSSKPPPRLAGRLEPLVAAPDKEPLGPVTKVSRGRGLLPNADGQIWREYEITPYTNRVTKTKRPERILMDWILDETGPEIWHGEVPSVLAADHSKVMVYHTPEVQQQVLDLLDRFNQTRSQEVDFRLQVYAVDRPDWRSRVQTLLTPLPVETAGVQAWAMRREDAGLMLADLAKRYSFQELSSRALSVGNGEPVSVVATRPRQYIQGLVANSDDARQLKRQMGQLNEGFALEVVPLLSRDGRAADAMMICTIDQIEKLDAIPVQVGRTRQRTDIEIPQIAQFRLHERLRWPSDQVLLVSLGLVPQPIPNQQGNFLFGPQSPGRAEVLILLTPTARLDDPEPRTATRNDSSRR